MKALIHNDRGKTREYTDVVKIVRDGDSLRVTRNDGENKEQFAIPEGLIVEVVDE